MKTGRDDAPLLSHTLEVEAEKSEVQDHLQLHGEFKANLGYVRPYVNKTTTNNNTKTKNTNKPPTI